MNLPRHEWWSIVLRDRARDDVNLADAITALLEWVDSVINSGDICDDCPFMIDVEPTSRRGVVTIKVKDDVL